MSNVVGCLDKQGVLDRLIALREDIATHEYKWNMGVWFGRDGCAVCLGGAWLASINFDFQGKSCRSMADLQINLADMQHELGWLVFLDRLISSSGEWPDWLEGPWLPSLKVGPVEKADVLERLDYVIVLMKKLV